MKLNKFPTLLLLAVMTLVMSSCEKEHWDASDKSGMKCAFVQETASFDIPSDEVIVTLKRSSAEGELAVPVYPENFTITVGNDVYAGEDFYEWFYMPETAVFADGSDTATISITAIGNGHASGFEYSLTLVIDNEYRTAGDNGIAVYIEVE